MGFGLLPIVFVCTIMYKKKVLYMYLLDRFYVSDSELTLIADGLPKTYWEFCKHTLYISLDSNWLVSCIHLLCNSYKGSLGHDQAKEFLE